MILPLFDTYSMGCLRLGGNFKRSMIFYRRPDPAGVPTSAADSDPGAGGGRGIPQAVSQEEGSPGYHESYYLNQVISF